VFWRQFLEAGVRVVTPRGFVAGYGSLGQVWCKYSTEMIAQPTGMKECTCGLASLSFNDALSTEVSWPRTVCGDDRFG
jgi:hypothetical protein